MDLLLDLVEKLGFSTTTDHRVRVKAHDSTATFNDSEEAAMNLYHIDTSNVSSNLTLTKSTSWAVGGRAYTMVLSSHEGYVTPPTIGLFVGTSGISDYTYDPESGVISITNGAIINNYIKIYAAAHYEVTFTGTLITSNGAATVGENSSYTATLTASTGYRVPDSITVKVDGHTLGGGYTWTPTSDHTSGQLTITSASIVGSVEIIAVADITLTFSEPYNRLNFNGDTVVPYRNGGVNYTATITSKSSSIHVPTAITVATGGRTLTPNVDYTWTKTSNTSGTLVIYKDNMTGNITIMATAIPAASLASPLLSLTTDSVSQMKVTPDDSAATGAADTFYVYKGTDTAYTVEMYRFWIDNVYYWCEAGMTWYQWVQSDYAPDGFTASATGDVMYDNGIEVKRVHWEQSLSSYLPVHGNNTIDRDKTYVLQI